MALFVHMYSGNVRSWKHEEGSVLMLRHILQSHDIDIEDYGLDRRDQVRGAKE